MSCPTHTFFHSATFHSIVSHALSLITIPVNCYGIYLILFKSDKTLRNAKWVMLNSQIWSTICNLLLTNLLTPFVIFPVAGGYPLGLLTYLKVQTIYQMILGVGAIAQVGASMVIIFENQQNHLVTNGIKLKTKTSRRVFVLMNHIAGFTFFVPTFFRIPDQEKARQEVLGWFTCPPPEYFTFPIFILADDPLFISALLFSILMFYVVQAVFFISHCSYHLVYHTRKLSTKTKKLQRKFFISVCVQIFLPFSIIGVPVGYYAFSLSTGYYNQVLNNLSIVMMSLHGFLATIATILIYDNMRKEAFLCCEKNNEVASTYQSS